ncbi:hypothetical protein [Flavobacterium sp.]|uniref:hypothetical protein n=1 Tax=Flavobacterium sp. TaxID=239 RepID=UPI00374D6C6F
MESSHPDNLGFAHPDNLDSAQPDNPTQLNLTIFWVFDLDNIVASTSLSLTILLSLTTFVGLSNLEICDENVTSFFALGMGAASPDLEKQGFLAVVFVNWEYSGQPDL